MKSYLPVLLALILLGVGVAVVPALLRRDDSASTKLTDPHKVPDVVIIQDNARVESKDVAKPKLKVDATYLPPVVSNERLADFVNRGAPLTQRLNEDMSSFLPDVRDSRDASAVVFLLRDPLDNDIVRNEAANLLQRSHYPDLEAVLMSIISNEYDSGRFRGWATQHLGTILLGPERQSPDASRFMQNALKAAPTEVRREALLALCRLRDPIGRDTAISWIQSRETAMEPMLDIAIRCCAKVDAGDTLPRIRELASHGSERIRVAAVVALGEMHDRTAVTVLQACATDQNQRIRKAALVAIAKISESPGQVGAESVKPFESAATQR